MTYNEGDMIGMHEALSPSLHVFTAIAASDAELCVVPRHVRPVCKALHTLLRVLLVVAATLHLDKMRACLCIGAVAPCEEALGQCIPMCACLPGSLVECLPVCRPYA